MNKKFYKILPADLNCKDFQYQEGLNIDTKPIDDEECSNGLHFSDAANIMEFISYGSMIADVEVPEDAIVYHFNYKSKANKIILKNIRPLWEVNTLKALVDEGVDIHADDDFAFRYASSNGYLEVVKLLIDEGVDVHAWDDYALRYASSNGYLEIVKLLLNNGADVHALDDSALRYAKIFGFTEIVDYLQSVK